VTPLSLGIETLGGVFTKLIERNTTIPTRKSETFSTAADNQTSVEIHVLQGERPMARDNKTLGKFHLVGIPPAPRGVPQVEVTFDIDANGIVHVSAKDLGTGREQKIRIEASSGLGKEEIDRMVRDAESHADEDRRKKEDVELRNQADTLVYQTEKTLEEHGAKISPSDRNEVEEAIKAVKSSIESGQAPRIKEALDRLTRASHRVAQAIYQQSAHGGGGGGTTPPAPDGEAKRAPGNAQGDVIDAEYVDDSGSSSSQN
jgi:molecular chaperone DnaK